MLSPTLPVSLYTFTFKALQPIFNVNFSAGLWHGQFGRSLRHIVQCVQPHSECKDCMLLHQCDYAFLFNGTPPVNREIMRKYQNIPVPYAFCSPISLSMQVQTGELFSIQMRLIGTSCHKLPIIIKSMENIGQSGLEKKRYRATLNSVSVQYQDQQGQETLLYANGLLLSLATQQIPMIPPCPAFIRLQWCSPYRAKSVKGNQKISTVDSAKLMMSLIRRVSLLQNFYTDTPLSVDFIALKKLSSQLEKACIKKSLQFSLVEERFSAKHKQRLPTSGVLGSLDFSLQGLDDLWPYLFLGQFLNVGQNASMGFGRYKLMVLQDENKLMAKCELD